MQLLNNSQHKQWDVTKIKRCEELIGQALLRDEATLVSFSRDFGKLTHSMPAAVCIPENINVLQSLISYAHTEELPITIRGNGLSQCGQSLPIQGGLTISMTNFNQPLDLLEDSIWVEANCSWANLLQETLALGKAPYVLPYNCNLSVAGVLSVGGIGASSFKDGTINSHVTALEVIDGCGQKQIIDQNSSLFHASLAGQGQFAVITKAEIKLRAVKPKVRTFYLVYENQDQWFADIDELKAKADYIEVFCSPSLQGLILKGDVRVPMAQWLYGIHISIEHDGIGPQLSDVSAKIKPMKVLHMQDESISSYMLRHNIRFETMKKLGQWELYHPWYECFLPSIKIKENLSSLLDELPIHYASFVQIVPIAKKKAGFFMFPDADEVCEFMILNPGIPEALKDSCLQAVHSLDEKLLAQGGKRYLSGYVGQDLSPSYWEKHFGAEYERWLGLKKQYDPAGIFSSWMYRRLG